MSPALNPNNPFVLNEEYFKDFENKTIYKQTTLYLVRLFNDNGLILVGLPLSILVFYLIINQMPSNFKPYRKMLVLSATIDTFMMIANFLLQTRLKVSNGYIMYTFSGPISTFGFSLFCPGMFLQAINSSLGCAVLPVQYYYRFKTVVRNQSPSILQTFAYFCISSIFTFAYGFNSLRIFCLSDINPEARDFAPFWYNEVPIPILLGGSISQPSYSIHQTYGTLLVLLYYLVAIWFAVMTMRAMNRKLSGVTVKESTKRMQAQIAKTLLAQSFIPLFTSVIPRFMSPTFAYLNIQTKYSGEIVIMIMYWFPIISLASTIVFIVPFRRFCLRAMPCYNYFESTKTGSLTVFATRNTTTDQRSPTTNNQPSINIMH